MSTADLIEPASLPTAQAGVEIVERLPPLKGVRAISIVRLIQWVLLIALATLAMVAGIELRAWYFIESGSTVEGDVSIRFRGDIDNAFNQGSHIYLPALQRARADGRAIPTLWEVLKSYRDRYDIVAHQAERWSPDSRRYGLDYPPARLLTMTLWVRSIRDQEPEAPSWIDDDLWPLLHFNTFMAAVGAVGVFLLVRYWGVRATQATNRDHAPADVLPLPLGERAGVRGSSAQELPSTGSASAPTTPHPNPLPQGERGPEGLAPRLHCSRAWDAMWGPFIAACLFWLNAALLSNAHTWPQWDVWLMPGYIWAAYFCSRGWWFTAGVSIALACVFKGQILIVAPVLLLWPLFQLRLTAVLRALVGFLFAMALMTAAWLYGGAGHGWWIAGMLASATLVMGFVLIRNRRHRKARIAALDEEAFAFSRGDHAALSDGLASADNAAWAPRLNASDRPRIRTYWIRLALALLGIGAVLLALYPWSITDGSWRAVVYLIALALLGLPVVFSRAFPWGVWIAAIVAGLLLLGPVMFDGSYAWARVGFLGPTDNHRGMHMGMCFNLASILSSRYGVRLDDPVAWAGDLSVQHLSRAIYGILLVLIAAGLALHAKLRSRAALVAIVAPWLAMFAVLMQMHERYLTYAAAISAILVGYRFGFVLLHLLITVLATALLHHPGVNRAWWPEMHDIIRGMNPGAGWTVLLLAAVFVWVSVRPSWRPARSNSEIVRHGDELSPSPSGRGLG